MAERVLKFTTSHYNFELVLKETRTPLHMFSYIVGNKDKPCLEGNIILENTSNNNRFDSMENTATLIKIDALQECSLNDINDEYMEKYSFGTELLDSLIFFINSQFPSIMSMSLNDASYIPCIRESNDTLDLLIYSIALYKKTWYENKLNAYIKPKEKYNTYRKQVELYGSKETKQSLDFIDIYKLVQHASEFTKNIFNTRYEEFESIFKKTETLPDFFKSISNRIERNKKCRFFKDWLERFITSYIHIERTWYFDLFPKIEIFDDKKGGYFNQPKLLTTSENTKKLQEIKGINKKGKLIKLK